MAKRMIKAAGLDWEVHLTLDREAALKGADFVSTQFRVGLLDARIKDERILSHGVLGQKQMAREECLTIPVILAMTIWLMQLNMVVEKQLAYVMCRLVIENKRPKCWEFQKKTYSLNLLELIISGTAFGTKKDKSEHKNSLIYGPKQEQESHLKIFLMRRSIMNS